MQSFCSRCPTGAPSCHARTIALCTDPTHTGNLAHTRTTSPCVFRPLRAPSPHAISRFQPYAIPACARARQTAFASSPTRGQHPHACHTRSYARKPASTQATPPAVRALPNRASPQVYAHPSPPKHLSSAYADIHDPMQHSCARATATPAYAHQVRPIPRARTGPLSDHL